MALPVALPGLPPVPSPGKRGGFGIGSATTPRRKQPYLKSINQNKRIKSFKLYPGS